MRLRPFLLLFTIPILAAAADVPKEDQADLAVVNKIRLEAFQNSQIMDTLWNLSDLHGPRVTNSKGFRDAADWAVKRLEQYGLVNVKQEAWGTFGKSWDLEHYEGHMLEPQ